MGFLSRLFGKGRADRAPGADSPARVPGQAGHAAAQTADQVAATRSRMEAEMAESRRNREQASTPDA